MNDRMKVAPYWNPRQGFKASTLYTCPLVYKMWYFQNRNKVSKSYQNERAGVCFHKPAFISKEVYKRWQGHHSRLHYFNWITWCDETCVNWLLNVMKKRIWFRENLFCSNLCTVSSDFTADEKMEIESIKTYKKDLLDDIQVNAHTFISV